MFGAIAAITGAVVGGLVSHNKAKKQKKKMKAIAAEESRQLEEEKARAKRQRARLFETAGGSAGEEVEDVQVRRRDLFGNKDKK